MSGRNFFLHHRGSLGIAGIGHGRDESRPPTLPLAAESDLSSARSPLGMAGRCLTCCNDGMRIAETIEPFNRGGVDLLAAWQTACQQVRAAVAAVDWPRPARRQKSKSICRSSCRPAHELPDGFRNCLAHSVSQITANVISQKTNLRTMHGPKPDVLHKRPINPWPQHRQEPCRPGRHDSKVDDPLQRDEQHGDQQRPPSGDGGSPDSLLENVVHGDLRPNSILRDILALGQSFPCRYRRAID